MRKKLIIPTIAATIFLTGCSAGGLEAVQADVELLKREVADLKAQLGSPSSSTETVNPSTSTVPTGTKDNGSSGLGESFVVDGVTYTFTEGERKPQLADNIKANEGQEFAIYNVNIHNTSNDDFHYSQSFFSIVTGSGEIVGNYLILDLNNKLDELGTGDLASNGQRSGWIAFQIPKGDQPLEIRYEEISFSKKDRTSFKVKLR